MTERKRGGRKPLDPSGPSVPLSVSLPSRMLEALREQARREAITLPDLLRRKLTRRRPETEGRR